MNDRTKAILVFLVTGIIAFFLMFWITESGPGVSPDSVKYLKVAANLIEGEGYTYAGEPLTQFPPGYPIMLSIAGAFNSGKVFQSSRLVQSLLFSFNIILIGYAVYLATVKGLRASVLAMLFMLVSTPALRIHAMVWSEPGFILFSLLAIILISKHIVRPTLHLIIGASVACAFALLIRYIGIILIPTAVFSLFLFSKQPKAKKVKDTVILISVSGLPIIVWLVRNTLIAGTATNRSLVFHPVGIGDLKSFIVALYMFIVPNSYTPLIKGILLGIVLTIFLVGGIFIRRNNLRFHYRHSVPIVLPLVGLIYSVLYIAFLIISMSFFDASTPIDTRIMLPVAIFLFIAGISFLSSGVRAPAASKIAIFTLLIFVVVYFGASSADAYKRNIRVNKYGIGLSSQKWNRSSILSYIKDLEEHQKIYTNSPAAIQFQSGKESILIPRHKDALTEMTVDDYDSLLQLMCEEVELGQAIIVYLNNATRRRYIPSKDEIASRCGVPVLFESPDGVILGKL